MVAEILGIPTAFGISMPEVQERESRAYRELRSKNNIYLG
jgi:hypothetical protein